MRKRVVAHGRVQGVFFRDSTRQRAQAAGVVGWVTNRPDGAVEAVFEGEPEAVRRMIGWCHSDRSGAEVHATSVYQETPSHDLINFEAG